MVPTGLFKLLPVYILHQLVVELKHPGSQTVNSYKKILKNKTVLIKLIFKNLLF